MKKNKVVKEIEAPDEKKGLKKVRLPIMVSLKKISESEENPNVQSDAVFDKLVESIKEDGVDEPIIVVPHATKPGHYTTVSGHHRAKAARVAGYDEIPVIVHDDWDDDRRKVELVRRNVLRGSMDPTKFTKLFNDVAKSKDRELIKSKMGFTNKKQFEAVYQSVAKSLNTEQRKQLDDAKEEIKSVDDLSSVLNTIFKEHGSTLNKGFMVFSWGGKKHHYYQVDKQTERILEQLEAEIVKRGVGSEEFFRELFVAHLQGTNSGKLSQFPVKKKPSK